MLLDRAARSTVRNFSTLFLVCMFVFLPLELVYATLHRDEIATRELHPYIERVPRGQEVRGVGEEDIEAARRDRIIVAGLELVVLPLLLAATGRVLDDDRRGRLPTATDAWRHALGSFRAGRLPPPGTAGAVLLSALFALSVGIAAYLTGRVLSEVFPDRLSFAMLGTVEAVARSVALPWFLVTWAQT